MDEIMVAQLWQELQVARRNNRGKDDTLQVVIDPHWLNELNRYTGDSPLRPDMYGNYTLFGYVVIQLQWMGKPTRPYWVTKQ